MSSERCKQPEPTSRSARRRVLACMLLAGVASLAALSACGTRPRARVITIRTLETAAAVGPNAARRAVVSDTTRLEDLCYYPLGRRLGLLQIRSAREWERLRRCAPELGPSPDFDQGIVIGLTSRAGMPVAGTWPIYLEGVRVHNGAGFALGRFEGGSFLPDGTTYVEMAQFEGLTTVLMVEVNGLRFYPD